MSGRDRPAPGLLAGGRAGFFRPRRATVRLRRFGAAGDRDRAGDDPRLSRGPLGPYRGRLRRGPRDTPDDTAAITT